MLLRLLHLLPVLSSTVTLMFAIDEHIFLGTWTRPSFHDATNVYLPPWFKLWGRRGRWVIILGYPINYALALLNIIFSYQELHTAGATKWYVLGLLFSIGHIAIYGSRAIKLLDDIKNGDPKGNVTHSMETWLVMNWKRALTTDFPAWICFIVGALAVL